MNNIFALCLSALKIGLCGWGGGSALIPMIDKEFVESKHFISEEEFNDIVVIASITPGPLPVEIVSLIGYRVAKCFGMIALPCLMVFPGVVITLFFLSFIHYLHETVIRQINFAILGVISFVIYLQLRYIYQSMKKSKNEGKLWMYCVGTISVFGALNLLSVNIVYLWIIFLVCFWIYKKYKDKNIDKAKGKIRVGIHCTEHLTNNVFKEICSWFVITGVVSLPAILYIDSFGEFIKRGILSIILSFGGGDAYITVADNLFVATGIIKSKFFYSELIPIVNLLPGSVLCKSMSGLGYYIGYQESGNLFGGYIGAVAGLIISISLPCLICILLHRFYEYIKNGDTITELRSCFRILISGLALSVCVSLMENSLTLDDIDSVITHLLSLAIISIVCLIDKIYKKSNYVFLVLISMIFSLIFLNFIQKY